MRRYLVIPTAFCLVWVLAFAAFGADLLIGSPDAAPTRVDAVGAVYEDWGSFQLQLEQPPGAGQPSQSFEAAPAPTVTTRVTAGPVTLTQKVYRAPIRPAGVDVLTAQLQNAGTGEAAVRLGVAIPQETNVGESVGALAGRAVLGLPQTAAVARRMKPWGCVGGVTPLPGWAKPQGECDPAFKNISAGMGGVPIKYRFAVPDRENRPVVLGFCESHWSQAGQRPLVVEVEGAPKMDVDPLAMWGQHKPGCLKFDASDENGDGYLDVQVSPHPKAPDQNPILNVIWVFKSGTSVDLEAVRGGAKSGEAVYCVDVGGPMDQSLYEPGPVAYELKLAPGQTQELVFVLAGPGANVPNPKTTPWTPEQMAKAAADLWRDCFVRGNGLLEPAAESTRQALSRIVLARDQASGYFLALPEPGKRETFSNARAAEMIAALDQAGLFMDSERLLRLYWDKPAPEPFAAFSQQPDGQWQDAVKDAASTACVLEALARHALVTKDSRWAAQAWPAIKLGADYLRKPEVQAALPNEAKPVAARALESVDQVKKAFPQASGGRDS